MSVGYRIGTSFSIDIVSVTSEISVIFRYFIIFSRLFDVNLKTDLMWLKTDVMWLKLSILFGIVIYVVTTRYISTRPKRKLGNNIDAIHYFAGDNEKYE